ncbi:MAG: hypothetical protein KDD69_02395, partial [Bdellovibrionales bacterium]|nr:hypothetical protein [Bdellovibrionales bacterium]
MADQVLWKHEEKPPPAERAVTNAAPTTPTTDRQHEASLPTVTGRRPLDFVGRADQSHQVNRLQDEIRVRVEEDTASDPASKRAASRIFGEKVNFLQAQIHDLRQHAEAFRKTNDTSWLSLEGSANLAEQKLVTLLKGATEQSAMSVASEASTEIDNLFRELQEASRTQPNRDAPLAASHSVKEQLPQLLHELGIDSANEDVEHLTLRLQYEREHLDDRRSQLADSLTTGQKSLQRAVEVLNEQTREHRYHFFDSFTRRYEFEQQTDKQQLEHIGRLATTVQALEQQLGQLHEREMMLSSGLSLLRAVDAEERGNPKLAARHLLAIRNPGGVPLTRESTNGRGSQVTALVQQAASYLGEEAEKRTSLGQDAAGSVKQSFNATVDAYNNRPHAALSDIHDQVTARQGLVVLDEGTTKELFPVVPKFGREPQQPLMDLTYRRLQFMGAGPKGEQYTLLF